MPPATRPWGITPMAKAPPTMLTRYKAPAIRASRRGEAPATGPVTADPGSGAIDPSATGRPASSRGGNDVAPGDAGEAEPDADPELQGVSPVGGGRLRV